MEVYPKCFWRKKIGVGDSLFLALQSETKVLGSRFKMMTWKHFFHIGIRARQKTCGMFKADRSVSAIDTAVQLQPAAHDAP